MLSAYCLSRRAWKKRIYTALIERRTIARAAAIHATGQDEARDVARIFPGLTMFVIPHGMESEAWRVPAAPDRLPSQYIPSAAGKPIVLFLGRLHPVKGITDLLLPAFARLTTPAHLALAGGTDSRAAGYDREVAREIDRLGLADHVSLLGDIPRDDRWHLFDGAAVFVLPSFSENFGMVVAEAMARGCPVVVTDTVNASEHVAAAGCGVVVPRDVGRLAEALTNVLTDPTARTRLGGAGARYAADRLAWPRVAEELVGVYQTLLTDCRPARTQAAPTTPVPIA
jgi:glycosyltransferase involved in cell wall biosynthesis